MNSISMRIPIAAVPSGAFNVEALQVRAQGEPSSFSWLRAIGFGLLLSYVVICSFIVGYAHVGPALKMFLLS